MTTGAQDQTACSFRVAAADPPPASNSLTPRIEGDRLLSSTYLQTRLCVRLLHSSQDSTQSLGSRTMRTNDRLSAYSLFALSV